LAQGGSLKTIWLSAIESSDLSASMLPEQTVLVSRSALKALRVKLLCRFEFCLWRYKFMEWRKARKLPKVIEFREVQGEKEVLDTLEGEVTAVSKQDFVVKGVDGELYPCKKDIFRQTYDLDFDETPERLKK